MCFALVACYRAASQRGCFSFDEWIIQINITSTGQLISLVVIANLDGEPQFGALASV